jgi:3-oxoacyl-[acyl-carrier protein] reductase
MKTVIVTGSSRGIGRATARKFAENGWNVVLNCVEREYKMREVMTELARLGVNADGVRADVSTEEGARRLFKAAERLGGADALVNNAGIELYGLFCDASPDMCRKVMDVNFGSVMNCCRLAAPRMVREGRGAIINVSSIWGVAGAACETVYSASKGAVNAFTRALAKELAPSGARVNAVACGAVETDMNARLSGAEKLAFEDRVPLSRFAAPREIAEIIYFLASDAASYITGQIITADGGFL